MLRVVNLTIFVFSLLIPLGWVPSVAAETVQPTLIFSEVKVRTDTASLTDYDEFIEIYNVSDQPQDLANFNLEYFNTTNPSVSQQPTQKPLFEYLLEGRAGLVLAKQPVQIANSRQSPFSSLSDSGGRLRLVTAEGLVVDEIAWTNTLANATAAGTYPSVVYQCNSSTVLCNSNRTQSISRSESIDDTFTLTDPIWQLSVPTPSSTELLAYPVTNQEPEPPISDPNPGQEELPQNNQTCEGIVISELLPNPGGADIGKEFIELYNPTTEAINLEGCSLQTSASTKKYALPNSMLQPGTYAVFSDSVTGLVLPNNAGGTAWLLSPVDELSSVIYPGGIEDDAGWALVDAQWQVTYNPTPASLNISMPLRPCPNGQTRSSETSRCQAPIVAAVATLAPCRPGQERNAETNRCKTLSSTVSALVPCKPGQERNPETNRCRAVLADESLSTCPTGQERSTETNRCRKVIGANANTLAAVSDVKSSMAAGHPKWLLAIAAVLFAAGYAIYEWRKDIALYLYRFSQKLKG